MWLHRMLFYQDTHVVPRHSQDVVLPRHSQGSSDNVGRGVPFARHSLGSADNGGRDSADNAVPLSSVGDQRPSLSLGNSQTHHAIGPGF